MPSPCSTSTAVDEDLGCAECAAPVDGTWPYGSDICGRCWAAAEEELAEEEAAACSGP
ncbi:hypothetical protein [Kitasatospora sp. NPDC088783]|uniref:hypothetical protein n=1 Tax=Kitasatospora sp. NPDC088783 TaxID=3364077 RepID=UPI00380705CC